jgi:hypothetical protein
MELIEAQFEPSAAAYISSQNLAEEKYQVTRQHYFVGFDFINVCNPFAELP